VSHVVIPCVLMTALGMSTVAYAEDLPTGPLWTLTHMDVGRRRGRFPNGGFGDTYRGGRCPRNPRLGNVPFFSPLVIPSF
jgi:hypothetical protein